MCIYRIVINEPFFFPLFSLLFHVAIITTNIISGNSRLIENKLYR